MYLRAYLYIEISPRVCSSYPYKRIGSSNGALSSYNRQLSAGYSFLFILILCIFYF